tara:strand:+ start:8972 stop:9664 length:693 start_codon:yes stop_codon:yes gene_type:complete
MSLVEVDPYRLQAKLGFDLVSRSHSEITPPASPADRAALLWVRSIDNAFVAETSRETPPIWLYKKFRWGPHVWPVRWSNVPHLTHHDCGLMAALSTEILSWRGWTVFPAQFVLYFNPESTRGWSSLWKRAGITSDWCAGKYAYHEGTAVLGGNGQISFWDPLGRFWLPVPTQFSYEGIVAVRYISNSKIVPLARYDTSTILPNRWYRASYLNNDPEYKSIARHSRLISVG